MTFICNLSNLSRTFLDFSRRMDFDSNYISELSFRGDFCLISTGDVELMLREMLDDIRGIPDDSELQMQVWPMEDSTIYKRTSRGRR